MRALATLLGLAALGAIAAWAQSYGEPPTPRVVAYVQDALQHGDLASAAALVAQYRRLNGDTPEALDALSWEARGELAAGHLDDAWKYASEVKRAAEGALGTRKLDAEPYLPIALGSAYEVEAQVLVQQHKRAEALQLLRSALRTWRETSIAERLQKNLNELTLVGTPVPRLEETAWIGSKPALLSTLRGKAVLLFFWAHWCVDCKAEAPVIAQLATEFSSKGLVVLAPTRLYGYTADDDHPAASKETAFIEKVYAHYYAAVPNAGVPLSSANFERFGVSTTPTIVLVDQRGIVRLYRPGAMEEAALRAAIAPLLPGAR
ncbi:MAG: TlpA family protein disulfide reductase [Acidobacteriaceae bacterium]|nr:TlpA family protein disulfide reductase [Acidobacteriaceae bacterium]